MFITVYITATDKDYTEPHCTGCIFLISMCYLFTTLKRKKNKIGIISSTNFNAQFFIH